MSWLSDPDRLERLARSVLSDPPNSSPHEVSEALNDAAARIRNRQNEDRVLHAAEVALYPKGTP